MSDTFLVQIQEAEEKAQKIVEKALENKQRSLQETRQRLAKETKANVVLEQEKIKQDLQASRGEARQNFEKAVEKVAQEAKTLEVEKGSMIGGLLSDIEVFLLKELRKMA